MSTVKKSRPVGINHLSLEVSNIAEALEFYGSFLELDVVYEDQTSGIPREELASIEMGDQFIALTRGDRKAVDRDRHFGLVVDDKELVKENLQLASGSAEIDALRERLTAHIRGHELFQMAARPKAVTPVIATIVIFCGSRLEGGISKLLLISAINSGSLFSERGIFSR